jgi:diacylglycerol kinase (ATP)
MNKKLNDVTLKSWGSGANPWGPEKESQFQKPTHYDGMLEVVGIRSVIHMGQIQSGLSSGIRIAQGGRVSQFSIYLFTSITISI